MACGIVGFTLLAGVTLPGQLSTICRQLDAPGRKEAQHVQIEAIRVANPDDTAAGVWAISLMHVSAAVVAEPPQRPRVAAVPGTWLPLLSQYADWDTAVMERILACESHGDENAVSPDGQNWGGLQINVVNYPGDPHDLLWPATNVAIAHRVWLRQGYGAWACY